MRYAIVADIHSNIVALEAVLADARARGEFDEVWCLGDIVGYGPRPCECVDLLASLPHKAVAGNHDRGATGAIPLDAFTADAAEACRWSGDQLQERHRRYLDALPMTMVADTHITLSHGSLRDPLWEYVLDGQSAAATLALATTRHCLVGHSHLPLVFHQPEGETTIRRESFCDGMSVTLGDERFLLTPGSVGQPRDGDSRAAYALYDVESGSVALHRVTYDVGAVQKEMDRAKLPRNLVLRLSRGW